MVNGRTPDCSGPIVFTTVLVVVLATRKLLLFNPPRYTFDPSKLTTVLCGLCPPVIEPIILLVLVSIIFQIPSPEAAPSGIYMVLPSGVIAMLSTPYVYVFCQTILF